MYTRKDKNQPVNQFSSRFSLKYERNGSAIDTSYLYRMPTLQYKRDENSRTTWENKPRKLVHNKSPQACNSISSEFREKPNCPFGLGLKTISQRSGSTTGSFFVSFKGWAIWASNKDTPGESTALMKGWAMNLEFHIGSERAAAPCPARRRCRAALSSLWNSCMRAHISELQVASLLDYIRRCGLI